MERALEERSHPPKDVARTLPDLSGRVDALPTVRAPAQPPPSEMEAEGVGIRFSSEAKVSYSGETPLGCKS